MKKLKKLIVNIVLFFLCSLTSQSLFATEHIVLTNENIKKVAASITTKYGNGGKEFETAVLDFLYDQLPVTSVEGTLEEDRCEHFVPTVIDADFGKSITFGWDSEIFSSTSNNRYIVNNFHLGNYQRQQRITTDNYLLFKPLTPGFYIFSFIKDCRDAGGQSNPVIIIADKDIFLLPPPAITASPEADWRSDSERTSSATISQWQVSPNPFEESIHIQWQATKKEQIQILLFDLHGRLLRQLETTSTTGQQSFWFPVEDLQSGYYILQIQTGNQSLQQKLLKH